MKMHKLAEELSVAPQLDPAEIPFLAANGIRAIICNRPDGEAPGQPCFGDVEHAAAAAGIRAVYQPVLANAIGEAEIAAFAKALKELPNR